MTKKVSLRQVRNEVKKYADKVSGERLHETISNEDKYKQLFQYVEVLSGYWDDMKLVFSLLNDFSTGKYKNCPWRVIAALVGALVYVLTPIDLIPDYIPVVGWIDDYKVLAETLKFAMRDLEEYRTWKFGKGHRTQYAVAYRCAEKST